MAVTGLTYCDTCDALLCGGIDTYGAFHETLCWHCWQTSLDEAKDAKIRAECEAEEAEEKERRRWHTCSFCNGEGYIRD